MNQQQNNTTTTSEEEQQQQQQSEDDSHHHPYIPGQVHHPPGHHGSHSHETLHERLEKKNNWKKKVLKWKFSLPFHILVFSFSLRLYASFLRCANDILENLYVFIEEAEQFFTSHPIDFSDEIKFKQTRNCWHEEFSNLVSESETKYHDLINHEDYKGSCSHFHPILYLILDGGGFALLILLVGYFVFQDLNTSFGASRTSVLLSVHLMFDIAVLLSVLNFPIFQLLSASLRISRVLEESVQSLKELQRHALSQGFDIDKYYLYAHIWDGYRFGVPDPVTGEPVDKIFQAGISYYMRFSILIAFILVAYLLYRANVKSMSLWRSAIPSVVCIGVVFPSSDEPNKLYRLGSGCIVDSKRGLILTNWHLFQKMGDDSENYFFPSDRSDASQPLGMFSSSTSSSSGSTSRSESGGSRNINTPPAPNMLTPPLSPSQRPFFSIFDSQLSNDTSAILQNLNMDTSTPNRTVLETVEEQTIRNSVQTIGSENIESITTSIFQSETIRLESDSSNVNESIPNNGNQYADLLLPPKARDESDAGISQNEMNRLSSTSTGNRSSNHTSQSSRKLHRHLNIQSKFSESFTDLFPDMRIVVGCTSRDHPIWMYSASFLTPSVESPSAEYAPFGLDLLILKIDKLVSFTKLTPSDSHSYIFESMDMEDLTDIQSEGLVPFKIADPWKEVVGDSKIKVLGYPASGGFTLSVLTGYFTGISYDHPATHRGSWLNLNIALPHGGSGGAAVNAKGELLGIGTQTRGEMTNIRSIQEAYTFIMKAKKIVDESKQEKEEPKAEDHCSLHATIATLKNQASITKSQLTMRKLAPNSYDILSSSSTVILGDAVSTASSSKE